LKYIKVKQQHDCDNDEPERRITHKSGAIILKLIEVLST
jgi:hypothetical protein